MKCWMQITEHVQMREQIALKLYNEMNWHSVIVDKEDDIWNMNEESDAQLWRYKILRLHEKLNHR